MDFQRVLGELKRTAYVGVGTFGSATVGSFLDDYVPGGDASVAAGQMALGAGAAVLADDRLNSRETRGLSFDAGEAARHASYGVGGAGFAELADVLRGESSQSQMVEVRTRSHAGSSSSGSGSSGSSQSQTQREELSVDI